MLIDISSLLSRTIHGDQVQTVSATLEQLMTGEGNRAAASSDQNGRSIRRCLTSFPSWRIYRLSIYRPSYE